MVIQQICEPILCLQSIIDRNHFKQFTEQEKEEAIKYMLHRIKFKRPSWCEKPYR